MGILDGLLGKFKKGSPDWAIQYKCVLRAGFDEIESEFGRPSKAKGNFIYWRGEVEDFNEAVGSFQLSNCDPRKGNYELKARPKNDEIEEWFLLASSEEAALLVTSNIGGRILEVL